jgi:hypothetical protein
MSSDRIGPGSVSAGDANETCRAEERCLEVTPLAAMKMERWRRQEHGADFNLTGKIQGDPARIVAAPKRIVRFLGHLANLFARQDIEFCAGSVFGVQLLSCSLSARQG